MDDLDRALIEAWWRVWGRCQNDPAEARRRYLRAIQSKTLNVPSRAWCLSIRASDTRITKAYGLGKYVAAREPHTVRLGVADVLEWCGPVRVDYPGVPIDVAADRLGRHVETVRRWLPVKQQRRGWRLDPRAVVPIGRGDGLPKAKDVAEWRAGMGIRLNVDYEWSGELAAGKTGAGQRMGWGVRYERPAVHGRHSGAAVPVVWCRGAIDPGHQGGVRPHPAWGSCWEGLAKRYAARAAANGVGEYDDMLVAERVPRWRERRVGRKGDAEGKAETLREFRGWEWACPGLGTGLCGELGCASPDRGDTSRLAGGGHGADGFVDEEGGITHKVLGCGRRAGVLVCPLPAWTIGDYLADHPEVRMGLEVGEVERWVPGVRGVSGVVGGGEAGPTRPGSPARPPMTSAALCGAGFACVGCWGVRNVTDRGRSGWNEFVGRMSGGLLSGRDVERVR